MTHKARGIKTEQHVYKTPIDRLHYVQVSLPRPGERRKCVCFHARAAAGGGVRGRSRDGKQNLLGADDVAQPLFYPQEETLELQTVALETHNSPLG